MTLPMMGLGGTGVISVASHVAGPRCAEMVAAQVAGDHTHALRLHLELLPLFKGLFKTANPILVKEALKLQGFPVGERAPAARARHPRAVRRAANGHGPPRPALLSHPNETAGRARRARPATSDPRGDRRKAATRPRSHTTLGVMTPNHGP